jgi:septal ring factor EnvC (AmiA/AmiB activator)
MKVLWHACAVVALALLVFSTTGADAQEYRQRERWHHLQDQIHEAQAKIEAGVRDASLTHREADRLRKELNRIESRMKRAGQDGLSRKEIDRLDQDFAKLERDINKERHDAEGSRPRGR